MPPPLAPDPAEPPLELPPELRPLLARYEVLGELGSGGMAVVYHARERAGVGGAAPREVAVKVVSRRYTGDVEAVRRFEREARTVAGLDHPNIVCTLAIEPLGGDAVAIVTQYVRGVTLRQALRAAGGPFDFGRAAGVLRDVAAALAYAHARRIVHRDVKPENIFVDERTGRALLADFGIARPLDGDSPLTVDGAALGTPTYMAPEQIAGARVDERTDVYALGLVGWEMVSGRRPWQGETLYALLYHQQHSELPDPALLRPDIPAYLLAALRGALDKAPEARWRDGAEFLSRLSPAPVALPDVPGDDAAADTLAHGTTVRVPAAARAAAGADAAAGGPGQSTPAAAGTSYAAPWPATPPRPTATPTPAAAPARVATRRSARARRWAVVAATLAALGLGGAALLGRQRETARRADDSALTGVTDEQLDSLLHAAGAAARQPAAAAASAPAAAPRRPAGPRATRPTPTPAPARPGRTGRAAPAADRAARNGTSAGPASAAAGERAVALADSAGGDTAPAAPAAPAAAGDAGAGAGAGAGDPRCARAGAADQRACLLAAIDASDAALNRTYQALIGSLRRRAGGAGEPPAVQALRVEQRAWVDARDRQCRAALAGREGPLWGAARAPCFAALSSRRAAELRARLERADGGDGASG